MVMTHKRCSPDCTSRQAHDSAFERLATARAPSRLGLLLGLLAACEASEPGPAAPTLDELHERVLQPSCVFSTCHGSGSAPAGGLSLARDVAHERLVGRPSSTVSDAILVEPNDPDASYVMEKLTLAMPAAGESMPPGAPLEPERIELVRAWIEAGAPDD